MHACQFWKCCQMSCASVHHTTRRPCEARQKLATIDGTMATPRPKRRRTRPSGGPGLTLPITNHGDLNTHTSGANRLYASPAAGLATDAPAALPAVSASPARENDAFVLEAHTGASASSTTGGGGTRRSTSWDDAVGTPAAPHYVELPVDAHKKQESLARVVLGSPVLQVASAMCPGMEDYPPPAPGSKDTGPGPHAAFTRALLAKMRVCMPATAGAGPSPESTAVISALSTVGTALGAKSHWNAADSCKAAFKDFGDAGKNNKADVNVNHLIALFLHVGIGTAHTLKLYAMRDSAAGRPSAVAATSVGKKGALGQVYLEPLVTVSVAGNCAEHPGGFWAGFVSGLVHDGPGAGLASVFKGAHPCTPVTGERWRSPLRSADVPR